MSEEENKVEGEVVEAPEATEEAPAEAEVADQPSEEDAA